ncbi:hypothetical protein [Paraburkholderia rhynchosiae]|nr:hypothetical protein [Paraburkholderia rhynchosiae]
MQHPFRIVSLPAESSLPRKTAEGLIQDVLRSDQSLSAQFQTLAPAIQTFIVSSSAFEVVSRLGMSGLGLSSGETASTGSHLAIAREQVKRVLETAPANSDVLTIGLIDLGARIADFDDLLARLNASQNAFFFVEVQAPMPAGLVRSARHVKAWVESNRGGRLTEQEVKTVEPALFADDFVYFGKVIKEETAVDLLIGVAPTFLAQIGEDGPDWRLHTSGGESIGMISTRHVRQYASQAERPYEAAVGMLIVGQAVTWSDDDLQYHKETRGCVLDFNDEPDEMAVSIRAMTIEERCVDAFAEERYGEAARAMMNALSEMRL